MAGLSRRQKTLATEKRLCEAFRYRNGKAQKSDYEPCKNGMGVFLERGLVSFRDSAAAATRCCRNTQFLKNDQSLVTFCDASA